MTLKKQLIVYIKKKYKKQRQTKKNFFHLNIYLYAIIQKLALTAEN